MHIDHLPGLGHQLSRVIAFFAGSGMFLQKPSPMSEYVLADLYGWLEAHSGLTFICPYSYCYAYRCKQVHWILIRLLLQGLLVKDDIKDNLYRLLMFSFSYCWFHSASIISLRRNIIRSQPILSNLAGITEFKIHSRRKDLLTCSKITINVKALMQRLHHE